MKSTIPTPAFTKGFVKSCAERGMSAGETEAAWHTYHFNAFLATPGIYNSFREKVASYSGDITKAAMAKYMTPAMLALSAECHIKYASDKLSQNIRAELGLPEPSWDTVPEDVQKVASALSNTVASYAGLPLQQKVMLAAMIAGGANGMARAIKPNVDDQMNGRGGMHRFARGFGRGAMTGAGFAAGSEAGGELGLHSVGERGIAPGMAIGGVTGGVAANRLFS